MDAEGVGTGSTGAGVESRAASASGSVAAGAVGAVGSGSGRGVGPATGSSSRLWTTTVGDGSSRIVIASGAGTMSTTGGFSEILYSLMRPEGDGEKMPVAERLIRENMV